MTKPLMLENETSRVFDASAWFYSEMWPNRCPHGVTIDVQSCCDCTETERRVRLPHYRWSYSAGVWVLQGLHRLVPPEVFPSNLRPALGASSYLTSSRDLWQVL